MIMYIYQKKKGEAKALIEKFKGKSFYSKVCHFRYERRGSPRLSWVYYNKHTIIQAKGLGEGCITWTYTKILTKLQWTEGITPLLSRPSLQRNVAPGVDVDL